jgi:hypothetical protein
MPPYNISAVNAGVSCPPLGPIHPSGDATREFLRVFLWTRAGGPIKSRRLNCVQDAPSGNSTLKLGNPLKSGGGSLEDCHSENLQYFVEAQIEAQLLFDHRNQ